MIFEEVKFETNLLKELKNFYVHTLDLELVKEDDSTFTVAVGETDLTFVQTDAKDEKPFYHFAFNIEESKFKLAKAYLATRVTLLQNDFQDEFEFVDWNAHAVYFYDPSGNIVEYIARHNIKSISKDEFTNNDILCVSEVGLPVLDVSSAASILESEINLPLWKGNGTSFQPVGDEHGLFILVNSEREWFPTNTKAGIFPVTVKIKGNDRQFSVPDLPYEIF
ncbi:ring-cleaving dioxygenase [Paenibacillus alba]|uniref:VOC family protein n=1 Tax=Paenibacillus alba TaxID=1197127 RepID=UPI00156396F4|nr:ring-cleaving dioxygenase [Paenibacillus alba]NQX69939.1 ring-cleaving dioxygenase [Paenibacillus alba]